MRWVLLDNTVLSNFAVVEATDLVLGLWGQACAITTDVWAEYQKGVEQGLVPIQWQHVRQIELTAEEQNWLTNLPPRLGAGESSSLAVAYHRQGLLATDDRDARQAAVQWGVPTSGTLGILIAQVKRGHINLPEGNQLLGRMIQQGYRSPVEDLNRWFT
jgi:predicted nucleic acid-binding protein